MAIVPARKATVSLIFKRVDHPRLDIYVDLEVTSSQDPLELKWLLLVDVHSGLSRHLQTVDPMETETWNEIYKVCLEASVLAMHHIRGEVLFQIGAHQYIIQNHRLQQVPSDLEIANDKAQPEGA